MKKNLLKIIALTVASIMAVSVMSSCGSKKDADTEAEGTNTLTMATNAEFPPYEYYDGKDIVGIDAEVAAAIADKLGMELKIVDTAFDSIIPAIQAKKYDIGMAGMTVNDERLEQVNFSQPYAKGVQVVIVKEDSDITDVDDLFAEGSKHNVGVQTGTTGDIYTTEDIESADLGTVSRFNKGADAVEALKIDKVDCVVIDNEPAKAFVEKNPGLKILDTAYADEDYAIAVAKDNTELLDKINSALDELKADGTFQKIVDKYITAK
ncbi:MAG: basic amino acid ABC transporter substrate-binding protein [Clostridiales bacterium]|nr:basic amino acid ABC transporter substrate-binding protein [Clostridiales bacterium]